MRTLLSQSLIQIMANEDPFEKRFLGKAFLGNRFETPFSGNRFWGTVSGKPFLENRWQLDPLFFFTT